MPKPYGRSAQAALYRRLYRTARWQRLREAHLTAHPLCTRCLAIEVVEEATVVHHTEGGHKGDEERFWNGPFESLCKACHDRFGALEDRGVKAVSFGNDGWPVID